MTLFQPGQLDLDAYLTRIDAARLGTSADLQTLRELVLLHPRAIPFENLNPLMGRPVRLDIASIQEKLVRGGRGGWCYEHNLLMGTALTALGFDVTGLSARVVWNVPAGVVRSRTHMVLHVRLDGRSYIADAGFGGCTPTAPLLLETGTEQQTPHEPFRLTSVDGGFLLEAKLEGSWWKSLYHFDLQPQMLADYEMPNWYLCRHPESHFLAGVIAARVDRDRRFALRNTDFAVHFPHSPTERRVLAGAADIRHTLNDVFRVTLPDWPDLDERLEQLTRPAAITQPT